MAEKTDTAKSGQSGRRDLAGKRTSDDDLPDSLKADLGRGGKGGAEARANAVDHRRRKVQLEADARAGGKRAEEIRDHEQALQRAAERAKRYRGRQDPTTR